MKSKFLATTAVALVAMTGAASAQSVLERVLGQIDNATNLSTVNGSFANIAENIGGLSPVNTYTATTAVAATGGVTTTAVPLVGTTQAAYDAFVARNTVADVYNSVAGDEVYYDARTGNVIRTAQYNLLSAAARAAFTQVTATNTLIKNRDGTFSTQTTAGRDADLASRAATLAAVPAPTTAFTGAIAGIDGSIKNVIDGISENTQQAVAGSVKATEFVMPKFDFGSMATTALGAVNTGDITIGVNASVDDAKTTSTRAVSTVMSQLGGTSGTGAIMLNIASNMTGINGSINNTMSEINGTTGALSTTALGAVNTGKIVSGINSAVNSITGVGGTTPAAGGTTPAAGGTTPAAGGTTPPA